MATMADGEAAASRGEGRNTENRQPEPTFGFCMGPNWVGPWALIDSGQNVSEGKEGRVAPPPRILKQLLVASLSGTPRYGSGLKCRLEGPPPPPPLAPYDPTRSMAKRARGWGKTEGLWLEVKSSNCHGEENPGSKVLSLVFWIQFYVQQD